MASITRCLICHIFKFAVAVDGAAAPKGSMTYDPTHGNFLRFRIWPQSLKIWPRSLRIWPFPCEFHPDLSAELLQPQNSYLYRQETNCNWFVRCSRIRNAIGWISQKKKFLCFSWKMNISALCSDPEGDDDLCIHLWGIFSPISSVHSNFKLQNLAPEPQNLALEP